MKNWLWTLVLISLVVPLVGCGAPDVQSQQPEQALRATRVASGVTVVPTLASSPTVEAPAPTDPPLPTAEEPPSTSTPLPTAIPTTAPPTEAPSATPALVLTSEDVQRTTPADAKELLDSGKAVLYDVRSAGEYRAQHAVGAVSFPASDLAARYGELPTEKSLIFYWTWPREGSSARVALNVISQGMDPAQVYALLGGLAAWGAAGYPVEAGEDWPFVGTGCGRELGQVALIFVRVALIKPGQAGRGPWSAWQGDRAGCVSDLPLAAHPRGAVAH